MGHPFLFIEDCQGDVASRLASLRLANEVLSPYTGRSGFQTNLADSAYEVIFRRLAVGDWHRFDWMGVAVWTEDELISSGFDVTDGAGIVFQNSVQIQFALTIRLK